MKRALRSTAVVVVIALVASLAWARQQPKAFAADPGVSEIVNTLDGGTNSLQSWTQGLGGVGKLADALPAVQTSPGSVLGFSDLLHQWFNNGAKKLASAASDSDLNIDEDITLGDGRAGHLKTTLTPLTGGKQVDLTITSSKSINDEPLSVPIPVGAGSNAPQSSFSSLGGVALKVTATLTFSLVWEQATNTVYIVANGSTPSLAIDASANFPNKAAIDAVKASIGILGVSLDDTDSSLSLDAHFIGTVNDPNNDGKLAFNATDGGELAQPGSLAGLVTFGFANPAGALNAHLHLHVAAASSLSLNLPAVDATIDWNWSDISQAPPAPTASNIDVAGKFLNMSPRDLAVGIGQLVTNLTMIQQAKSGSAPSFGNLNLPFLKGSLADVVKVNEILQQFLKDWTFPECADPPTCSNDPDPSKAGLPKFVSLQDFFDALNGESASLPGGETLSVSDVGWQDPATMNHLSFTLNLTRPAGSPISVNAAAAAATGGQGSTYTQTTLTDNSQTWKTDEWKGHHVVAGNSGGTVASNDAHTLTLETAPASPQNPANPGWSPTIPPDNSAYAISGNAGDVGNVELGDSLKSSNKGIGAANAVNTTAMVTPSYEAHVTLVLDVEPPTLHDPPLEVSNSDGSKTLESSTPTGADRVLVDTSKTDLFNADFPIDAGIDINANAGFLQVELKGSLHVGTNPSDTTDHMLQVQFKDNGLLSFGDLVQKLLNDPTSLLDFKINVGASGSVDASAPGTADLLGGGTAKATFTWNDLTQTSGSDGPQFDLSQLNPFTNFDFDPSNPKALYSIVLKTLQTLDAALGSGNPGGGGSDVFTKPIPVIGKSLSDLLKSDESGSGTPVTFGSNTLTDSSRSSATKNAFPHDPNGDTLVGRSIVVGTQVSVITDATDNTLTVTPGWTTQPAAGTSYIVRSELDDAISLLEAQPPDNLQSLINTINGRFKNSSPIQFEYRADSSVGNTPSLVINLDWERKYDTSAPVNFNFNLPSGTHEVAGVQGSGSVSLGLSGEIKVGLVVALAPGQGPADASALQILDNSGIKVKLDAGIDDATLTTTLGPLNVSLGDPKSADKGVAHASYSVDLAKSGATTNGTAESFSQFLSDVSPGVNTSSDAVQSKCGTGFDGESTDLSLCAKLPIYFSTDGGTTYNKLITCGGCSDEFDIRLPKDPQGGAGAFDVIDPTGSDIDGHPRIDTPDATALADAIKSTFDFSNFASIDGFLNLLQQSLNTASFGGKLPLIGNDLQQGADFLGQLKTTIDSTLGSAAGIKNVGDLRDYVNNTLKNALSGSNLNPTVALETQCTDTLGSAGMPTVALHTGATAASATYTYEIVSYASDGSGGTLDTQPSSPGDIMTGPTTLTSTDSLDVSWTAVTGAEGYKVYKDVSGTFELLKDVGNVLTFTDDGSITPTDPPTNLSGPNPKISNCSFDQLDTVIVKADVSVGKFKTVGDHEELDCGTNNANNCVETPSVPLNIGIPGLSLSADKSGEGPKVQLGWHLHLAFGISKTDGFFIATKDDPQPELAVGLNFTLPSQINAQLAFINITAQNCDNTMTQDCVTSGSNPDPAPAPGSIPSLFDGTFSIDMLSPNDPTNGRLSLADISNLGADQLFDVKLHTAINIDWLLKATVAAPGTQSTAGFPGIQAEFRLKWSFDNVKPGTDDQTSGDNSPLTIEFDKVAINAGQILGHLVGPIVQEIKKVTGPLDPIIKTLYAPIPVLSDLSHLVGGGDITIITIAQAFSTLAGGPDLSFVKTIANLITFIDELPVGTSTFLIPIGSFKLVGSNALSDTATPDNTDTLIDKPSEQLDSSSDSDNGNILGALDQHNEGNGDLLDPGAAQSAGFSFPVFEKPASLFNLIMGGDVDLVKFDSGPLTLGFDWRQEFGPVYAPPPVLITLHGSASVTLHIVAGFDTYGIRKAFEAAKAGTLDFGTIGEAILQSLFFYTNDDKGKPLPVVSFTGEIATGAEVSVVLITVGIEGGVGLTVSFLWNDPNHDGKFRISEFLATALNNPICLFSVSGQLFVFLKLYVSIGIGPFSVSFSFTIVNVTLLDFSATPNCTPPPPKLGALGDGGHTLVIYAAALGHTAQRGGGSSNPYESNNEDKDTVKITEVHDYTDPNNPTFKGIAVDMLGIRREFDNANIDRVIVDGRGYGKPMSVTFLGDGQNVTNGSGPAPATASFDKDAIVFGGNGDDQIKTGIGNSWVDGGPGNDTIVTGDRTVLNAAGTDYLRSDAKAFVAGGQGDDAISVGNGDDIVAGDSTLDGGPTKTLSDLKELVSSNDASKDQTDGNPTTPAPSSVTVPDWTQMPNPADGTGSGDGNDTIKLGLGTQTAFGNGGDDTLGVSADNALLAAHPSLGSLFHSQGATLVGGDGSDHIAGGAGDDTIFTASQTTFGPDDDGPPDTGSSNVVDTGTGNDHVYGSQTVDLVTGHSQKTESDDIRGGAGNDVLIGGFGTDKIYGGPGDDNVIAEPSTVDLSSPQSDGFGTAYPVTHQDLPAGITPSSKLLVGGTGNDHIIGGNGGAQIYGDGVTTPCVAGVAVASDPVSEAVNTPQDGNDMITGGAGVENVRAGGGDDYVDVKANNDAACGESGNDTLIGGSGDDQEWGGTGQDVVQGGDGNDKLYGNDGNDTVYGNDGTDQIEGNDGTDFASGGTGDDVIIGGTRLAGRPDEGDVLSGDAGNDTIIGDNGDFVGGVWVPLDLTGVPTSAGGDDVIFGGDNDDTCHGGIGNDTIFAGNGNDHCEGNIGNDTMFGQDGEDELVGGGYEQSSPGVGYPDGVDTIDGGAQNDVITGDNAIVAGSVTPVGSSTDTVTGRGFTLNHTITLLDLGYSPTAGTSAGDVLHGSDGQDVIYGQGGNDAITGDNGDDYAEGGPGTDLISGGAGNDDLVGGSSTVDHVGGGGLKVGQPDSGDTINGDTESDVIIGDNGKVLRDGTPPSPLTNRPGMTPQRAIVLYDLNGSGATAAAAGDDLVNGGDNVDVILGQGGNDRLLGNAGDDYVEGDQGSDAIEGDTGDDDLVGGSSTVQSGSGAATVGQPDTSDAVWGGPGDDVVIGDNALVLRTGPRTSTTDRIGTTTPATRMTARNISLYDLNGLTPRTTPAATQFGDDRLSGGSGVDVMYGQDGNDQISGGPNDDYLEGNGGADILRGDLRLDQPPALVGEAPTTLLSTVWPGSPSGFSDLEGLGVDGQDDMMGGSSIPGFRDGNDQLEGDGESDFQLGDNGTLKRDVQGADGSATERLYLVRYNPAAVPANASHIRMHDPAVANAANSNNTTRFCTTAQATCEPAGAFGDDTMWGDSGDDTMWGQDGNDTMHGGAGDDDMYGELGNDQLFGDAGEDAILGDRGGVRDVYQNGSNHFFMSVTQVPKVEFDGFNGGTVTRVTDLQHDIDGDTFVGSGTQAAMPHRGDTEGGDDRIRGGIGNDSIHAGFGDDLANGDSGADSVFGDDGADVIWGGKGCDQSVDTPASSPWCYPGGVFDPAPHLPSGEADPRAVDYIEGGKGGTSAASIAGSQGSDLLDWHPRGTYVPGTGCTTAAWPVDLSTGKKGVVTTVDPCSWFEMTNLNDADATNNQHHQGVDWEYGGWDRDVLQADVSDNGPNEGDRMLDWNGSYNLYTQCNSANGGFNAVRQHSPTWQDFLQRWVWAQGAGQNQSDAVTAGTSAFDELALVYPGADNAHGSGSAYPSTPGHFDNPNACAP